MALTDMINKTHSTYSNSATFYLLLWMDNDRGSAADYKQSLKDQYGGQELTEARVRHEIRRSFDLFFHDQPDEDGSRSFVTQTVDAWYINSLSLFDWPSIVRMYTHPLTTFGTNEVTHDDILLTRALLTSTGTAMILENQLSFEVAQVLLTMAQVMLSSYANTPSLFGANVSMRSVWNDSTVIATRIFEVYLEAVNWKQVRDDIVNE